MKDIDKYIDIFNGCMEEELVPSDQVSLNAGTAWDWLGKEEQEELYVMIKPFGLLLQVNDGDFPWMEFGKSCKERVLNFLIFVRKGRKELIL